MTEITLRCPTHRRSPDDVVGCGSTNVRWNTQSDGLCDCFECGIFFSLAEGIGLVEIPLRCEDGTEVLVYVKPDSPLVAGNWSVFNR